MTVQSAWQEDWLGRNGHKEPQESWKSDMIEKYNIPDRASVDWSTGKRHRECNGHIIQIHDPRAVGTPWLCTKCGDIVLSKDVYRDPDPEGEDE
jgi:hypothetical protein